MPDESPAPKLASPRLNRALDFGGLFLIFHRPLCYAWTSHRSALCGEGKLETRISAEGSVFTNLIIRNLHAAPIDRAMLSQSMSILPESTMGCSRCCDTDFDRNQERDVHSARVVMNPAKAPLRPPPAESKKESSWPDIFPERCTFPTQPSLSAIVRTILSPTMWLLNWIRAAPARSTSRSCTRRGQTWLKLSAPRPTPNRNLIVRDNRLADNERFRSVISKHRKLAGPKLAINFDYAVALEIFPARSCLHEAQTSPRHQRSHSRRDVPVDAINKFVALPRAG